MPGIACVLLEGKSQDGNGLAGDCVEETLDDLSAEAPALVVVDVHHLVQTAK